MWMEPDAWSKFLRALPALASTGTGMARNPEIMETTYLVKADSQGESGLHTTHQFPLC